MNARVSKTGEELVEPLTRREREILVLLAQGCSAPEIAQQLTLAISSVKWYVQQIYGKLGVNNKQRAILRAGELGLLETRSTVASVPFTPKHNLPSQLTSFIGREKEIDTVKRLIAPHSGGRLVTLTGAGGSGKTRLALEVAAKLHGAFPDGLWFIEFASLTDPVLVPQSLLTALGLSEQAGRSALAIVSDFLQPKRALLVLDNCEHLIQACAQLVETLLRACPTLHILTTSRETLSVAGETLYLVPTLTTPDPAQADLANLLECEAVRLFVERAQNVLPGFKMTNDNGLAIAQVCHQLDGIPLALELAAARVKILRVEQIAAWLAERDQFRLLISGTRTAPPRHQTLHALIDWSHDLLSESERVLLRRLAVFTGGWTLEAAEAVCAGDGVEADAVLDLLTQLVNKSIVLAEREQGQEARYRMLETIRQFASERLLDAGDGELARKRHFEFFLQWAEQVEPKLRGPQQLEWFNQIEAHHDNLRAALEWSLGQVEGGEASLRFVGTLLSFWHQRGYMNEGHTWLARALANPTAPSMGIARAKALYAAGSLACWQEGDVTMARGLLNESADLWRVLGPVGETGLAYVQVMLGQVMWGLGDPAAARSLAGEAIALFRELEERWGLAHSLLLLGKALRDQEEFALARLAINESLALWRDLGDRSALRDAIGWLGLVALRQGDYEVARRHFAESVTIARELGDENGLASALIDLGKAYLNLGDLIEAKPLFEECFRLYRKSDNKYGIAHSLYYAGYVAQFEGDTAQAKRFFEQELLFARTIGPLWLGAQALFGLAGVAAASGQALRAARLLGANDTRAESAATYTDAADALYERRTVALIVAQIGETEFMAARAEGRKMTFEQAADYALETEPSASPRDERIRGSG